MEADKLCSYLTNMGDEVDVDFVKKCLSEYGASEWGKGYQACLRHAKKRRLLRAKHIKRSASALQDLISDMTHQKNN